MSSINEILGNLRLSKSKGVIVSLKLRHHDEEFTTIVRELSDDVVSVSYVNMRGYSRNSFYLQEIEQARCLKLLNNAPLYARFSNLREKARHISNLLQPGLSRKTAS